MSANMHDLKADPVIVGLTPVAARLRQFAAGLVIKTEDAYKVAAERLKVIKGALAQIEDARTRITKPINDSLREVNAQAKVAAAPFLQDEVIVKNAMVRYSNEQDELRREEQRKANEAADKERRRLQAIADETARKAREEAEAKRRAAEEAAAAGRAEEAAKLAAQAQRIDDRAQAKVETFEDRAKAVVAPVAQQQAPKIAGVTIPKVWVFDVVDESLIPREYLSVDLVKIRKVVQALKGSTNIPGVKVREDKRIAAGMA